MKCQDCKYWTGEKSIVGRECLNPTKQKTWEAKEKLYKRIGYANPTVTARYKYGTAPACKQFEPRFSKYRVVIEPCYMVCLVNEDGEIITQELSKGLKEEAHKLADKLFYNAERKV